MIDSLPDFLLRVLNIKPNFIFLDSLISQFGLLTTDSDRFDFAVKLLRDNDFLPNINSSEVAGFKCLLKSIELRHEGNDAFKCKNYEKALTLYTKSISLAPQPDSKSSKPEDDEYGALSLAVANRSAVLFEMKKYELCLKDIAFAIDAYYPQNLLYKLIARKVKCLEALKKNKVLQNMSGYVGVTDPASLSANYTSTNIYKLLQNGNNIHVSDLIGNGRRGILPSFSDCVNIKTTVEMGRGLYATRDIDIGDIDIGEIIAVEKPFVSWLNTDYFYTHCHHCCRQSMTLIPCLNCSVAMFCSNDCRELSWKQYHSIDCYCIPYMEKLNLWNHGARSIKTVITASKMFQDMPDFFNTVKLYEIHDKSNNAKNFTNDDDLAASYFHMYRLVTNSEYMDIPRLLLDALYAACITSLLESKTDFFSNVESCKENEVKNFIGCLLMRHVRNQLHAVQTYNFTLGKTNFESVSVGGAICPDISLINHSCDPNVFTGCYHGNQKVVIATRAVKSGEQLFESYGPQFINRGFQERQTYLLERFNFTCPCTDCTEKWPLFKDIKDNEEYRAILKCRKCTHILPTSLISAGLVKCVNCNYMTDVTKTRFNIMSKIFKVGSLTKNIDRSAMYLNHVIYNLKIIDTYCARWSSEYIYHECVLINCFCQLLTDETNIYNILKE